MLLNATAHSQSEHASRYAELGWSIETEPRLRRCGPSIGALESEAARLASTIPDGSNVLVAGLGWLCDAIALHLLPRRCRLYTALTTRTSDDEGRFLFTGPVDVVETPLSIWWHEHFHEENRT